MRYTFLLLALVLSGCSPLFDITVPFDFQSGLPYPIRPIVDGKDAGGVMTALSVSRSRADVRIHIQDQNNPTAPSEQIVTVPVTFRDMRNNAVAPIQMMCQASAKGVASVFYKYDSYNGQYGYIICQLNISYQKVFADSVRVRMPSP